MKLKITTLLFAVSVLFFGCVKDDINNPVVTITGDETITLRLGDAFTDPGATANDEEDGSLTVTVTGTVDVNAAGTYTLTYSATDEAGNSDSEARTVHVQVQNSNLAGNYNVSEACSLAGSWTYSTLISTSGTGTIAITLVDFGEFGTPINLIANITGDTGMALELPIIPFTDASGITFNSLTGTINAAGTVITVTYAISDGAGGTDSCTATWTKI